MNYNSAAVAIALAGMGASIALALTNNPGMAVMALFAASWMAYETADIQRHVERDKRAQVSETPDQDPR